MNSSDDNNVPRWSSTTKLIVALPLVAVVAYLLWKFKFVLGPLLFAIILAYLLYPIPGFLNKKLHIPWRLAVTMLYLLIFLVLIGLLAWGGISLVTPLQNLVTFLQKLITDLPGFLTNLSKTGIVIGSVKIALPNLNLSQVLTELQGIISPALSSLGTLLGSIASGAISGITWTAFTLIIAYFFTVESSGLRSDLIKWNFPRYQDDLEHMKEYLSGIWGAFIRGQLFIFVITYFVYAIVLSAWGVKYALALAILAGLARFVPYVGPFVAWTTYFLVAFFQGPTIFGLQPFPYAAIIVVLALVIDAIMDNFVSPNVMSSALSVHPAAVLVMVIVNAQLFGFIGVLLSAPVLASLKLFLHYISRKMMDMDPWADMNPPEPFPTMRERFANLGRSIFTFFKNLFSPRKKVKQDDNHLQDLIEKEK
jgi:predicted PurR-regulated permease PerM